jgi:outer membrane protein OmpA-like peptidoglycan-associated protein
MMKQFSWALILLLLLGALGCSMNRTQKGTIVGATAGGAAGAVIGNAAGNTAAGAIIGAAVGGAAGAYIGHYMDEQAEEMQRDLEGAKVERVGEGIKITFDSGILFDVNRAELKPAAKTNLTDLAQILQKYDDTDILVEGHTDATGTAEHNLSLSMARAQSAANFLGSQGVQSPRFSIMGYGEDQPIADNATEAGREKNRRVELAIMANDDLKKVAEEKTEG